MRMALHGGIDLGGTKIQAVVVDDDHSVLGSARRPTPTAGGPAAVVGEMEVALRDAAKAAEVAPATLAGVGVGSPGVIEDGSVSGAGNLPGWEGTFAVAATLEGALGFAPASKARLNEEVSRFISISYGTIGRNRLKADW